jgi:hypothetical protein
MLDTLNARPVNSGVRPQGKLKDKGMRRIIFALLISIMAAHLQSGNLSAQVKIPLPLSSSETHTVDFCEVTRKPKIYDGKLIRIQAIWSWNYEGGSMLYPLSSDSCGHRIRPYMDCSADASCKEIRDTLKKNSDDRLRGRVGVVLVGRFRYQKLVTRSDVKYNLKWRYEVGVIRIEEAKKFLG